MKIRVGSYSVYPNEINVSFRPTRFVHMGEFFILILWILYSHKTAPKGKAQAREREAGWGIPQLSPYSPPHPISYRWPCLYNQLLATNQLNPRLLPPIFSTTVITLTLVRMYALCNSSRFRSSLSLDVSSNELEAGAVWHYSSWGIFKLISGVRLRAKTPLFDLFDYSRETCPALAANDTLCWATCNSKLINCHKM